MKDIPYLKLPYVGASTIEDNNGAAIIECVTPQIAEALVRAVNTLLDQADDDILHISLLAVVKRLEEVLL